MKILFFANTSWNLFNFRFHLIESLSKAGHDVHLLSPEDEYTHLLTEQGFTWHPINISRKGMNPFGEFATILRIRAAFKKIEPDIVFNFTPKCVLYGSPVARQLKIPQVINTISGLGFLFSGTRAKMPLVRKLVRGFYRFSMAGSKVIFQNPEDMDEFEKRHIIRKKQGYLVASSGVDTTKFGYSEENNATPMIMLPARLIREKGAYDFVDAARLLHQKGYPARFILVGQIDKGNPSAISKDQISQWVEEGSVEWWGWRSDMEEVLQKANIVCLPTFYREGTPKSLLEAAACGRAIIATNVPGCREIVRDGENGILIEPNNHKMLADAIQRLLDDPNLRQRMGKAGRAFVESDFQNTLITAKIMEVAGL